MRYEFEYKPATVYTEKLEIDDIGNVILNAKNTLTFDEYYLIIKTSLGFTHIIQYGPYNENIQLPLYVDYAFNRFEYNENKIIKIINNFISPDSTNYELKIIDNLNTIREKLIEPIYYLDI